MLAALNCGMSTQNWDNVAEAYDMLDDYIQRNKKERKNAKTSTVV